MSKPNLDFIRSNLDQLDDYKLDEMETLIKSKLIHKETGVYVGQGGEADVPNIRIRLSEPLDVLIDKVKDRITDKYGSINFRAYYALNSIITQAYLAHEQGHTYKWRLSAHRTDVLLAFIDYVMLGTVANSYADINKFLDANQVRYNTDAFDFKYNGVRIKAYKNGRIDIRFANEAIEQEFKGNLITWDHCFRKDMSREWI